MSSYVRYQGIDPKGVLVTIDLHEIAPDVFAINVVRLLAGDYVESGATRLSSRCEERPNTPDVIALCRVALTDPGALPILADALDDDGEDVGMGYGIDWLKRVLRIPFVAEPGKDIHGDRRRSRQRRR